MHWSEHSNCKNVFFICAFQNIKYFVDNRLHAIKKNQTQRVLRAKGFRNFVNHFHRINKIIVPMWQRHFLLDYLFFRREIFSLRKTWNRINQHWFNRKLLFMIIIRLDRCEVGAWKSSSVTDNMSEHYNANMIWLRQRNLHLTCNPINVLCVGLCI